MGIHFTCRQVSELTQRLDGRIGGDAGGKTTKGDVVVIEAVTVKGRNSYSSVIDRQLVGSTPHSCRKNADPEIDGIVAKPFFFVALFITQSTTGRLMGHTRTHTSQAMHLSNS